MSIVHPRDCRCSVSSIALSSGARFARVNHIPVVRFQKGQRKDDAGQMTFQIPGRNPPSRDRASPPHSSHTRSPARQSPCPVSQPAVARPSHVRAGRHAVGHSPALDFEPWGYCHPALSLKSFDTCQAAASVRMFTSAKVVSSYASSTPYRELSTSKMVVPSTLPPW